MSRRNIILLIIVLVVVIVGAFGFLYFRTTTPTTPGGTTQGTNFLAQFNPFGNSNPSTTPPVVTPPVDVSGVIPPAGTETPKVKLTKISSMPIAGYIVFSKERFKDVPITPATTVPVDATTQTSDQTTPVQTPAPTKTTKPTPPATEFMPALRYVERATGNIYQTFADKIVERKFSTTIIPKVYEAFFGNVGQTVSMRYLKTDNRTIQTFVGNLPKEVLGGDTTADNEVKGSFLPENIQDLSLSPDAKSIFYLFNVGDGIVGTTLNLSTNKKVQIFDSPFTEWLSQWPNSKMLTFTTKPAGGVPGYMYAMDPNSKNLNQILGNINGLTTLTSPSGKLVLYGGDTLSLNVYQTDTKVSNPINISSMPEKCVWGNASDALYCAVPKFIPTGLYPDSWYQGETSFSDQLWKIDVKTGNATLLLDPAATNSGEEVDGIKLALDAGENYLFFVNKKDSFLWELALK